VLFKEFLAYRCKVMTPVLDKVGLIRDVHKIIVEYTM
jgi:hypothetical protein